MGQAKAAIEARQRTACASGGSARPGNAGGECPPRQMPYRHDRKVAPIPVSYGAHPTGGVIRMNRFASIATTAALAGALIGAAHSAQATSTIYLVPISDLTQTYAPGAIVSFAAVCDVSRADFASLTVPCATAFVTTEFRRDLGTGTGVRPKVVQPTQDNPNNPGTPFWSASAQSFTTTTSSIGGNTVFTFQNTVGHVADTDANGNTIAFPAGSYTLGTFNFPIANTNTTGSATVYLPTPFGFSSNANATDGNYVVGTGPTLIILGKNAAGTSINDPLVFPDITKPGNAANPTGKFSSLVFKVSGGSTGGNTPAPSSLLVVAMGAIPAVGLLRRRSAK